MTVSFKEAKHLQKLKALRQQSEETMVAVYAAKYGVEYIDLSMLPINTDALRIIPEERARKAKMAAFDMVGREVKVAVLSPLPDAVSEEIQRLKDKKFIIDLYMVSTKSLQKA